jgi:hypothetical protein
MWCKICRPHDAKIQFDMRDEIMKAHSKVLEPLMSESMRVKPNLNADWTH